MGIENVVMVIVGLCKVGSGVTCVPAQDNHGFVANAIIELQPKISENPTSGQ